MLSWTRRQSGTTSLRAILYMDEIFGYFPPVANPPSKRPLLTLLKQARAFGVGVVLATQNPVDLDYKGSGQRRNVVHRPTADRARQAAPIEGLEGAASEGSQKFDRARTEEILAGLGKRVFLMNNVHEDAPVAFESRWALSYLRGPLTRAQIKSLDECAARSPRLRRPPAANAKLRNPEPPPRSAPFCLRRSRRHSSPREGSGRASFISRCSRIGADPLRRYEDRRSIMWRISCLPRPSRTTACRSSGMNASR